MRGGGRQKDIGWKMKKRREISVFNMRCRFTADVRQTRTEDCLLYMSCKKRKCIIINIKTRCFHSIRFSLKTFDEVEWTTGGLQFILACSVKNKTILVMRQKKTGSRKVRARKITVLN